MQEVDKLWASVESTRAELAPRKKFAFRNKSKTNNKTKTSGEKKSNGSNKAEAEVRRGVATGGAEGEAGAGAGADERQAEEDTVPGAGVRGRVAGEVSDFWPAWLSRLSCLILTILILTILILPHACMHDAVCMYLTAILVEKYSAPTRSCEVLLLHYYGITLPYHAYAVSLPSFLRSVA